MYIVVYVLISYLLLGVEGVNNKKLLLISLDGFRWDFSDLGDTPTLDWIKQNGVTANTVRNVFPTNTIPNHQSTVTGLYPENHGMLTNYFYDKKLRKQFSIGLKDEFWWNQSLPIWVENELQGHKSGVLYWPGFNVKYNGKLSSFSTGAKEFEEYEIPFSHDPNKKKMDFNMSLDLVFQWLNNTEVNFVAFYLTEPDSCFHGMGPDKTTADHEKKIHECVAKVDDQLKSIVERIKKVDGNSSIDVLITGITCFPYLVSVTHDSSFF